jgi:site-specific DNA-methyltransferase (adenine-specific)/site-specific DNA-methyltransferase (cytosine-N4-specific)
MWEIKSGSVDLWVTSPPYAKQRDYNGAHSRDYIDFIAPIFIEAMRTLKDDGSIFINIKEHCTGGVRDLYVFKMVIFFSEVLGFRYVDEYIWVKTNPFPTGAKTRLKDGYERVLHFTKSKKHKFFPGDVLVKSNSKWLAGEMKRANKGEHNVSNGSGMNMSKRVSSEMVRPSNVLTGSSSNINIGHPAVYPLYIPEFFIKLTTNEGDTVGDMFMGSGTTGVAAKNLNRNFIGIELDETYFNIAKKRINEA